MQRVDFAVDDHDAELAKVSVAVARIELIDQAHFVAGKLRGRRAQFLQIVHANEIAAGMEAGRPHQERKRKPVAGDGRGCFGAS